MKQTFRFLTYILAAFALLTTEAKAQVVDYGPANGILSFEESTKPVKGIKGSVISISDDHAKLGTNSLKWEWKRKGASLEISADVPYLPENPDPKETSVSSFVFWVYAPEAMEGNMRIAFLKDGRECCHFIFRKYCCFYCCVLARF